MMRTTGIDKDEIGIPYHSEGVCAMKSDMELVYFLTVRAAEMLAESHEDEEDWELWGDSEAVYLGEMKRKEQEIAHKYTRSAS